MNEISQSMSLCTYQKLKTLQDDSVASERNEDGKLVTIAQALSLKIPDVIGLIVIGMDLRMLNMHDQLIIRRWLRFESLVVRDYKSDSLHAHLIPKQIEPQRKE